MIKRISLITIIVAAVILTCQGKKQRLSLPNATTKKGEYGYVSTAGGESRAISRNDSLTFASYLKAIKFSGYDKKVSATRESFHISNNSCDTIKHITVKIDYLSVDGRQLHSRKADIETELPPGETRKADIRSWDTQKTFYYYRSQKPRSAATPYKVRFRLEEVSICGSSDSAHTCR